MAVAGGMQSGAGVSDFVVAGLCVWCALLVAGGAWSSGFDPCQDMSSVLGVVGAQEEAQIWSQKCAAAHIAWQRWWPLGHFQWTSGTQGKGPIFWKHAKIL